MILVKLRPAYRYDSFLEARDLQMLATISLFYLQLTCPSLPSVANLASPRTVVDKTFQAADYFSRRTRPRELSPGWPRLPNSTPSPVVTPPTASTAVSGRGSWSSLFNASISGRQHRDVHERSPLPHGSNSPIGIPVPARGRPHRLSDAAVGMPRVPFPALKSAAQTVSSSWGQARISPKRTPISFSSAGHGRRVNVHHEGKGVIKERKVAVIRTDAS
jgi:hypothetical protein